MKHKLSISLILSLTLSWGVTQKSVVAMINSDREPSETLTKYRERFPIEVDKLGTKNKELGLPSLMLDRLTNFLLIAFECDEKGDCYRSPSLSPDIPHIITPRGNLVLNNKPILRWYSVQGIDSYSVQVKGPRVNWEQPSVKDSWIVYGGPSLQPGKTYLLTVDANNGHPVSRQTFTMLTEDKAKSVRAEVTKIEQQMPNGVAKSLAVAQLYLKYGLNADALDKLEALATENSQNVEVYCTLGNLYKNMDLPDLAAFPYEKAKNLGSNCSSQILN